MGDLVHLFIFFSCSSCQRRELSYSFLRKSQKAVRLVRLRYPLWGREGHQQAAVVCVEQHCRAEQKVALERLIWEAWRGRERSKRALGWDLSKLLIATSLAVKLMTSPFHLMVKCEQRQGKVQSLRIVHSFSLLSFLPQVAQGRVSQTRVGSCSTDWCSLAVPGTWPPTTLHLPELAVGLLGMGRGERQLVVAIVTEGREIARDRD